MVSTNLWVSGQYVGRDAVGISGLLVKFYFSVCWVLATWKTFLKSSSCALVVCVLSVHMSHFN